MYTAKFAVILHNKLHIAVGYSI